MEHLFEPMAAGRIGEGGRDARRCKAGEASSTPGNARRPSPIGVAGLSGILFWLLSATGAPAEAEKLCTITTEDQAIDAAIAAYVDGQLAKDCRRTPESWHLSTPPPQNRACGSMRSCHRRPQDLRLPCNVMWQHDRLRAPSELDRELRL
jgi:hypothetical protein